MNVFFKKFIAMGTLLFYSSTLFLTLPAVRAYAESPDQTGQREMYQEAVDDARNARIANDVSLGLWGATAALCGYNCINYLFTLRAARKALMATASSIATTAQTGAACPGANLLTTEIAREYAQMLVFDGKAEADAVKGAAKGAIKSEGINQMLKQVPASGSGGTWISPETEKLRPYTPNQKSIWFQRVMSSIYPIGNAWGVDLLGPALTCYGLYCDYKAITGGPKTGNAGTGNAGTGNAGTGNAGTGNAGTGNAGTGNAGTGNAGTGGLNSGGGSSSTLVPPGPGGSTDGYWQQTEGGYVWIKNTIPPQGTQPPPAAPNQDSGAMDSGFSRARTIDGKTPAESEAAAAKGAKPETPGANQPKAQPPTQSNNSAGAAAAVIDKTPTTPSEESLTAYAQAMVANAAAAASTAGGVSATGVGAAACAHLTPIGALGTTLQGQIAPVTTATANVITYGNFCSYVSLASGVTDAALSMALVKDMTKGIIGLAGASPSIIGLFLKSNSLIDQNASAKGINSCFSSATSIAMVAMKWAAIDGIHKTIEENEKKVNELQGFLKILSPLIGCTEASASQTTLSACRSNMNLPRERLACGLQGDPSLARAMNTMPGGVNGFFRAFENKFTFNQDRLLSNPPPSMNDMVRLMTFEHPSMAPGIMQIFESAKQSFAKGGGRSSPLDQPTAQNQPSQIVPPTIAEQGTKEAQVPSTEREPASQAPLIQKPNAEGLYPADQNLFDIVSKRYQQDKTKIHELNWSSPFNKFSDGQ